VHASGGLFTALARGCAHSDITPLEWKGASSALNHTAHRG